MKNIVHILLIEDSVEDAALIERHLHRESLKFAMKRVDSEETMRRTLEEAEWDVILSDYRLPNFSGLEAFEIVKKSGKEIPFIIVSGTISEETAVAAMKAGVHDYIMKDRLASLTVEIKRALEDVSYRRKLRENEKELRESEERYRDLVEHSNDLICTHNLEGKLLSVNEAAVRLTGYSREALLQMNLTDLLTPQARSFFSAYLDEIRTAGHARGLMEIRTAKGETRIWEYDNSLRTEGMAVPQVRGMARDITEQKQSEKKLAEKQNFLEIVTGTIPDIIYLYDPRNKRHVYINREIETLLGYSNEKIIKSGADLILQSIHPEDLPKVMNHIQTLSSTPSDSFYEIEYRIKGRDGKYLWFYVREIVYLRNKTGQPELLFGICQDATERKRVEAGLHDTQMQLEGIFNSTMDAIITVDEEQKIIIFNPAAEQMYGCTAVDAIGQTLDRFLPDIVRKGHREHLRTFGQSNVTKRSMKTPSLVLTCLRADGSAFPSEVSISLLELDGRKLYTAIVRDITERKQAEQKLMQSESELREAQRIAHIGNWSVTLEDYRFHWSDEMYKIYGVDKTTFDITNESFFSLIHPEDLPMMKVWIEQTLAGEKKPALEFRVVHSDGSLHYVRGEGELVRDEAGRPQRVVGAAQDITDRKLAEQSLHTSELRFRTLVTQAPIGIYETDTKGLCLFVNPCWLQISGLSFEDALGDGWVQAIYADDRVQVSAEWNRAAATGTPFNLEYRFSAPRGVVTWVHGLATAVRNEQGEITGYFGTISNITDRKLAENALRASEDHYRKFFDNDLTGDYISTPEGRLTDCNPAFLEIFGFKSREEALHADMTILYQKKSDRKAFIEKIYKEKTLVYHEDTLRRIDGVQVNVVENVIGIFDEKGELAELRGYVFDDTKRKELEKQFLQAQKLESLGTLASGIAHDFNNILGIIIGHAALLKRLPADRANIQENVEVITKASMRGAGLVKQMLTFARKTDVLIESVMLNYVLDEVVKLLHETFPKTIIVHLHLEKDLPVIEADANQVHQVVLNLCVNARDAMPGGGTLTITTHSESGDILRGRYPQAKASDYIFLSVTDTGMGMDEETQQHIFEPFFTTKERGKGTGLGLSLVFGIMESHNGFVAVESELGKGTTFHCYFPVPHKTLELAQVKESSAEEIPGGSETILVVEDEEMLRELVKEFLEAKGYTVLTAEDGKEGVNVYQRHQNEIELVISDLGLPKFGGDELFRKLTKMNRHIHMIIASGYIEPLMKAKILEEGVKEFIPKPYDPDDVLRAVRRVLDKG